MRTKGDHGFHHRLHAPTWRTVPGRPPCRCSARCLPFSKGLLRGWHSERDLRPRLSFQGLLVEKADLANGKRTPATIVLRPHTLDDLPDFVLRWLGEQGRAHRSLL